MKAVGIIRDRGQLTIPESIRKQARWAGVSGVVYIQHDKQNEIIITPHQAIRETELNKLSEFIKKARDIKGKGSLGASKFLAGMRSSFNSGS
jgi:bifunctional DNA-binding transcriptional regulator/antitoxin component of YhaV-PrlF toxin-antitoxin module